MKTDPLRDGAIVVTDLGPWETLSLSFLFLQPRQAGHRPSAMAHLGQPLVQILRRQTELRRIFEFLLGLGWGQRL